MKWKRHLWSLELNSKLFSGDLIKKIILDLMETLIKDLLTCIWLESAAWVFNLFIWRLNTHTLSPRNLDVAGGLEVLENLVHFPFIQQSAGVCVCVRVSAYYIYCYWLLDTLPGWLCGCWLCVWSEGLALIRPTTLGTFYVVYLIWSFFFSCGIWQGSKIVVILWKQGAIILNK